MSSQYLKMPTSNVSKIISLYPCYQFVVRFERVIYNNTYNYLIDNNLISQNQSGFKRGDSCINQLISITHDILNSLDEGLEVRGVFLDISKAFDKVWHDGLIYKLQQNGISGELLNILIDFLSNRKQRLVMVEALTGLMLKLLYHKAQSWDLYFS